MKNLIAIISVSLTLLLTISGGIMGYAKVLGRVDNTEKTVNKIEEKQEKIDEYLIEQREINVEQKIKLETMQKILEKIDKKLE